MVEKLSMNSQLRKIFGGALNKTCIEEKVEKKYKVNNVGLLYW